MPSTYKFQRAVRAEQRQQEPREGPILDWSESGAQQVHTPGSIDDESSISLQPTDPETSSGASSLKTAATNKDRWVTYPNNDIDLDISDGVVHAKLTGTPNIHKWILEIGNNRSGDDHDEIDWHIASISMQESLETSFDIPQGLGRFIRVIAIDNTGEAVASAGAVGQKEEPLRDMKATDRDALYRLVLGATMVCFGVIVAWLIDEWRRGRQPIREYGFPEEKV
ncbi:hypothetical protein EJ04DRAFT_567343 [Polyplosphaeria fusca]|uniref:Uncharacterized protein n=1 Tax=Polyplosphaeria fusca TaxID=682080 RepID=A0A9P4UZD1_9PLEO|nr:hypothetical protein EJ04DRAFT_567343 [Polyplosphaeria fusca]